MACLISPFPLGIWIWARTYIFDFSGVVVSNVEKTNLDSLESTLKFLDMFGCFDLDYYLFNSNSYEEDAYIIGLEMNYPMGPRRT